MKSATSTCGAWLVLAGVSLNVVQKVMRHSTIKLTVDTYGHTLPGTEADAVELLAGIFDGRGFAAQPTKICTAGDAVEMMGEFFDGSESEPAVVPRLGTDDAPIRHDCHQGARNAHEKPRHKRGLHASDTHETRETMSPAGFEPTTYGLKVPEKRQQSSTFEQAQCTSDLRRLIQSWPRLSVRQRAAVVELVQSF